MTHLLDDARAQMREGHTSSQWELIAREKVMRTLLEIGEYTADDLAELNIPREYRQHVHGAATGFFSGEQRYMEEAGRRKSKRPSRKGAKNTVVVISAKGRRELPKLLRDLQRELPKLHQGSVAGLDSETGKGRRTQVIDAAPSTGRSLLIGANPDGARSSLAVEPGDTRSGAGPSQRHKRGEAPPLSAAAGTGSPDNPQDTRGQNRDKSDQGRLSESTSSAAEGVPGVLQLDIPRESQSSAYGTIVEDAA